MSGLAPFLFVALTLSCSSGGGGNPDDQRADVPPGPADPNCIYQSAELGVIMGPDGHLYVTTSNCDGRGTCPDDRDDVFRISAAP